MLLETALLTKNFGGLTAVNNIDFKIDSGEIVAIIGPNGSGKTTFFNLLSGLIPPTSGTISFNGQHIHKMKPFNITALGIARTFQNIRLFGNMTVEENLTVSRHCRSSSTLWDTIKKSNKVCAESSLNAQKIKECLNFVNMYDKRNVKAKSLSYGEQRRLEIARAMATEPKIILLDEPAAGMNPSETDILMGIIHKLSEVGATVILIEHQMRLVMGLSHRVIVFDHGAKLAEGSPKEVQNNPEVIEAYIGSELKDDEENTVC